MSIQNNTTGLEAILQAVNSLPDAGSGGGSSGGVTVQRKTGTVQTNSDGDATVTCGFKPDLVVIYSPLSTAYGNWYHLVFAFSEVDDDYLCACSENSQYLIYMYGVSTSNGFEIYDTTKYNLDLEWVGTLSLEFDYVAIKYTD